MSRGFGHKARVFVACATVAGIATPALAAPRRVAVVNVAKDQSAGSRASVALRAKLSANEQLTALPTGLLATALERVISLQAPRDRIMAGAAKLLAQAADARGRFADDEALAYLARAERALLTLTPDQAWRKLVVEINLLTARIVLARPAPAEAAALFRLVKALDPERKGLDPAVYTPAEVKLFAKTISTRPGTTEVKLSASYDGAAIWIDGAKVGVAPTTLKVAAGLHYVAAVFRDHTPEVQRVDWQPGQKTALSLRLRPMSTDARARALRRRLLSGPATETALLAAARDAATLAGVDAVALVRTRSGAVEIAIYDGRADKLGTWTAEFTPADKLLAPLLPPPTPRKRIVIPPPPPPPPPPVPWYRKRWAQALVGGGVAATIIGGFLLTRSGDGGQTMVPGPTWSSNPFE